MKRRGASTTHAFFMSDAHLGLEEREKEEEKERRIVRFFGHVKEHGTHLFIVGDLFDAWLEYRTVIPKGYHRLFTALEELTTSGVEVHYLAGNHDFWMRNFFTEYLGVRTYSEPFTVTIERKRFFIHHGDGLAIRDAGYRILKKVLRNPFNIWLFSWVHPDIGIALARMSSRKSRDYTAQKDYGSDDGSRRFAAGKIAEGFDYVIMGHRHRPASVAIGGGMYVNLGDWISNFTYAEFARGKLQLKKWEQQRKRGGL